MVIIISEINCFCTQNLTNIGNRLLSYSQKAIFNSAPVRHLEFYGFKNRFFEKPMKDFLLVANIDHSSKLLSF